MMLASMFPGHVAIAKLTASFLGPIAIGTGADCLLHAHDLSFKKHFKVPVFQINLLVSLCIILVLLIILGLGMLQLVKILAMQLGLAHVFL